MIGFSHSTFVIGLGHAESHDFPRVFSNSATATNERASLQRIAGANTAALG